MITNKYITKIIVALALLFGAACLCAMAYAGRLTEAAGERGVSMGYEAELFQKDEVIDVNIQIKEEDWQEMLENAISEQYYACDVEIGGTAIRNVGVRPKGNTSLTAIASDPDTDRYSFKLEFDHYVDGQTCFGLDKLVLNNNYADATNMKEALVYDMYEYLDADASLYQYAKVSVNGEYWGLYLAIEAVEESFLLRNYGSQGGALYKPESMGMGGGKRDGDDGASGERRPMRPQGEGDGPQLPGKEFPEMPEGEGGQPQFMGEGGEGAPDGEFWDERPQMPNDGSEFAISPKDPGRELGPMGQGGKSGGADLNYADGSLSSYETIWEGAVTDLGKSSQKRVVAALKNVHDGVDLEGCLDIENLLKYMAVHTFVVNLDSLTGTMAHNYYLYESKGRLNLLPWDYNLSFGGMEMGTDGSAAEMVNHPIDTPFFGTDFFDALLADETYLKQYHAYLKKLSVSYALGGGLENAYRRIREQIDALVETDPTAFYTYGEYQAGAETLYEAVTLRAQSVLGQLDGTIPSTKEGQEEHSDALLDASGIDLEVMGVMQMGNKMGNKRKK